MLVVGVYATSVGPQDPDTETNASAPSESETESKVPDIGGGVSRATEAASGSESGTGPEKSEAESESAPEENAPGPDSGAESERVPESEAEPALSPEPGATAAESESKAESSKPRVETAEPKYSVEFRFYDRDPIYAKTDGGTVRQILADAGYTLDRLHVPTIGADEYISYDATIDVLTLSYEPLTVTEEIPFGTEYVYDDSVPSGQSWETQAGVVGYKESMYTVEYINGQENYRSLDSEYVTSYPVNQIITVGTKPAYVDNSSGIITAADGTQYHYSKVLTVRATYYNLTGNTASGVPVSDSVIATDPSVIPTGTRVYLKNDTLDVGFRVAADTGVYGNTVDIWMNENSPLFSVFAPAGVWEMTCYILD